MYQPAAFREDRLEVQHGLIRSHPLGLLISAAGGLAATPVPFLLAPAAGALGTLRCHLARANPHWRDIAAVDECLIVFQGAHGYVSPSWYATKRETGKVVPTWNYAMVQAWGRPRVIDDAGWLRDQIEGLTVQQEGGRSEPWAVSDAPAAYIDAMIKGIIGIEIPIARIEGKWKMSQNRPESDRLGVIAGAGADPGASPAMAGEVAARAGIEAS